MRILIVEDEGALRESLASQLKAADFTVDTAADGEEGLYAAKEYPIDLAIIDLGLPKLSGIDLISQLRGAGRSIPILILTARDRWQEKVEGLQSGADDYLVKPFRAQELVARIGGQLSLARERRHALEAVERARGELHRLIMQIPSLFAILRGPEYRFELANDAYLDFVGRRDIVGRPAFEVIPEARGQGYEAWLDEVLATVDGDLDLNGSLGLNDQIRNGFQQLRLRVEIRGNAPGDELREIVATARARSAILDVVTHGTCACVDVAVC